MNGTLYKKEWKSNWILLVIFMAVLTMYAVMIIMMFDPSMGMSLQIMAKSMPQIFAAFGMANVGNTLLKFITGYLYGFLLTVFPAVYILILSNRLVARYVDNGSMVYLLTAPEKRERMIRTQAYYLLSSLLLLVGYVMGVVMLIAQILFPGKLDKAGFLRVNAGLFGLWVFLGGVCFLCSCIWNESKTALGIASAIVVYSILIQMIAQTGSKFAKLKYITPLTLFSTEELIKNSGRGWGACMSLYFMGIVCFGAGILFFQKKDLPL